MYHLVKQVYICEHVWIYIVMGSYPYSVTFVICITHIVPVFTNYLTVLCPEDSVSEAKRKLNNGGMWEAPVSPSAVLQSPPAFQLSDSDVFLLIPHMLWHCLVFTFPLTALQKVDFTRKITCRNHKSCFNLKLICTQLCVMCFSGINECLISKLQMKSPWWWWQPPDNDLLKRTTFISVSMLQYVSQCLRFWCCLSSAVNPALCFCSQNWLGRKTGSRSSCATKASGQEAVGLTHHCHCVQRRQWPLVVYTGKHPLMCVVTGINMGCRHHSVPSHGDSFPKHMLVFDISWIQMTDEGETIAVSSWCNTTVYLLIIHSVWFCGGSISCLSVTLSLCILL